MIVVLGMFVAIAVFFVALVHPRVALVLWLLTAGFIPFWVGITSPLYLPPTSLLGIVILTACFHDNKWRVSTFDLAVLFFAALSLVCGAVGIARPGDVANLVTQWVLSYFIGRLLVQRTGTQFAVRAVSVIFTAVSVGAIVEFFTKWNPYYAWVTNNGQYLAWGHPQDRGGIERAEWAFGHSIALGCSIALAIPLVCASGFTTRVIVVQVSILLAAATLSFSRSGIAASVFALVLVLLFFVDRTRSRFKAPVAISLGVVAVFAIPKIVSVFAAEGSRATISSDYRLKLNDLIPSMKPLGLANGYVESSPGVYFFRGFGSIDSTYILLGLSYGYLVAGIALIASALLIIRVATKRASAPMISVVAVIPALFTVALITQFGSLVWFYLGMAALIESTRKETPKDAVPARVPKHAREDGIPVSRLRGTHADR